MKKRVITICAVTVIIAALSQTGIANMLMMLLLVGAVPGTHYAIPFWAMMVIYCAIITLVVARYLERSISSVRRIRAEQSRKERMPRRRYSHI